MKSNSNPNKLLNPINSQHTGNAEKMANIFNDYFVTVGKHIANSIPPPLSNKYPVAQWFPTFFDTFLPWLILEIFIPPLLHNFSRVC